MQHAYSWMGSRIHLVLEDKIAEAYNRAMTAWFNAQKNHMLLHGKKWDPVNEAIWIDWNEEEQTAFDEIGKIINILAELNKGLNIPEEEMTSDFLVKIEED